MMSACSGRIRGATGIRPAPFVAISSTEMLRGLIRQRSRSSARYALAHASYNIGSLLWIAHLGPCPASPAETGSESSGPNRPRRFGNFNRAEEEVKVTRTADARGPGFCRTCEPARSTGGNRDLFRTKARLFLGSKKSRHPFCADMFFDYAYFHRKCLRARTKWPKFGSARERLEPWNERTLITTPAGSALRPVPDDGEKEEVMIKASEKAAAYEVLGNLSQHFEQVLLNLQRLRSLRVVASRELKDLIVFVEEARAWAAFEIVSALQVQEESDWARFNQLRMLSEGSFRKREAGKRDPEKRTGEVK